MSTTTYTVHGMTCGGCAAKVSSAVDQVAGVVSTEVDLPTGTLTVAGTDVDDLAAITNAGYHAG